MTLALHHAEDDPGEDIGSATAPALALAGIAGAGGGYFAGAWLYSVVHDR